MNDTRILAQDFGEGQAEWRRGDGSYLIDNDRADETQRYRDSPKAKQEKRQASLANKQNFTIFAGYMKKISTRGRLLAGVIRLLGRLPLGFHYAMSKVTYGLIRLSGYRKNVIETNLSNSFPEKSEEEIQQLVNGYYRHIAELIAEIIFGSASSVKRIQRKNLLSIKGKELLCKSIGKGRSVMVLSSHLGNWELVNNIIGIEPAAQITKQNVKVIYKRLSSKTWNDAMFINRKTPVGQDFPGEIESKEILKFILSHKKEANIYVMITDQYPYYGSIPVLLEGEFMHQKTYTLTAAAVLAQKLGMDVVNMNFLKTKRGHYEMVITPNSTAEENLEPLEMMRRYYDNLEKDINAYPATYLWSHRRWKNLPQSTN